GLQEVGKNCYCLEKNDDLIIVDCGVKFVNNNNLADGTIPNFTYLQENRKKIKGLFLTHAHEDHVGGIPYLLQVLPQIPVYGSEFSISYLKQKLGVRDNRDKQFRTVIFGDDTVVRTEEFRVSFFRVTHSIPGSFGLIVEVLADNSRIVLTGDFKFDLTAIGEETDLAKLAEAGKKGVDLLLSESTNAEIPGNTPSEVKVVQRLESLITEATVEKDDTIVLTSSPIMDNRLNVEVISNKLFALGAKIYENNKQDLLHASGHACQEDLKLMLKLVNPTYLMPIHGDFRMLKEHSYLAEEVGIPSPNVFVCENGEVVEAKGKEFFLAGEKIASQSNYVFNDQLVLADELNHNLFLREKMAH
ncbi:15348_t:CDS:2, partial [Racocetra persica]